MPDSASHGFNKNFYILLTGRLVLLHNCVLIQIPYPWAARGVAVSLANKLNRLKWIQSILDLNHLHRYFSVLNLLVRSTKNCFYNSHQYLEILSILIPLLTLLIDNNLVETPVEISTGTFALPMSNNGFENTSVDMSFFTPLACDF